ncbi:hypothetical protein GCM10008995_05220 [Halobellus salinus]|uniref:Uncharacterized protein n=1 Tax=Halobellus salinus TaxID=931585 RepID=A0A830ECF4_9EURY|nr:hypothetical protein GCM10008995_05220 [Halobellus salinus]SMP06356.1 hypothetical protein SAMN06265347_102155 [Halobellus salinus]
MAGGIPEERLPSPVDPESGPVTVNVNDPGAMVCRPAREGTVVRALPTPDAIHVSVHAANSRTEVDHLLDALEPAWT